MRTLAIAMAVLLYSPAHAQKLKPSPCDEAAALVTAQGINSVMSQLKGRLRSQKSLTPLDFDQVFDANVFNNSSRPFADIRTFEQRISETLAGESQQIRSSYRRWARERLEEGPLKPSVEPGENTITVALRSPQLSKGSLNLDINRGRIKMSYQTPVKLQPRGRPPARSRRYDKIMPIPEGADPDKYRIEPQPDGLLIIFDRAKYGATEASE